MRMITMITMMGVDKPEEKTFSLPKEEIFSWGTTEEEVNAITVSRRPVDEDAVEFAVEFTLVGSSGSDTFEVAAVVDAAVVLI